jgi:hypothetical protein
VLMLGSSKKARPNSIYNNTQLMCCVHGPHNRFENEALQMSESLCFKLNLKSRQLNLVHRLSNNIHKSHKYFALKINVRLIGRLTMFESFLRLKRWEFASMLGFAKMSGTWDLGTQCEPALRLLVGSILILIGHLGVFKQRLFRCGSKNGHLQDTSL